MLDHEGVGYYTLRSTGKRTGYAVNERANYRIDNAGKEKVENKVVPVEAIVVDVLFDVLERKPDITEVRYLMGGRKDSLKVEQWLMEHIGNKIGYEENPRVLLEEGWQGGKNNRRNIRKG
ncbi:hypothetical protein ABFG93_05665 [Pseudalkalibacillus hwajinpoensis]|uniref:hypothetical protein n=1 Tax=Guptibacillus hwajinpoensis TaxID=208199 RepID=UPI00325A9139